jgi:hypothetical protein
VHSDVISDWDSALGLQFAIEMEAALGISPGRVGAVKAALKTVEDSGSSTTEQEIIGIDVSFEVRPESLVRGGSLHQGGGGESYGGSSELHGEQQIGAVLTALINSTSGLLFSNSSAGRLKVLKYVDSAASLPIAPTTHRVTFAAPAHSDSDAYAVHASSTSFSAHGFQPLYSSKDEAHAASANGGGDGSASLHIFNGMTYWMPDGIARDHGTHQGYLDEFSGSGKKSISSSGNVNAATTSSSNPYPSFALSVFDVTSPSAEGGYRGGVFTLNAPSYYVVEAEGATVKVGVLRRGASLGAATVTYEAHRGRGGSATGGASIGPDEASGVDFQAVTGSLEFKEGETGPKFFVVPIANDMSVESSFETFEVRLVSVGVSSDGIPMNATLGMPRRAAVRIYDFADGYAFASSTFTSAGGYASYRKGWTVSNNGDFSPVWVDELGLYSVDQKFSARTAADVMRVDGTGETSSLAKFTYSRPPCAPGVSPGAAIQLQCDLTCGSGNPISFSALDQNDDYNQHPTKDTIEASLGTPITLDGEGYVVTPSEVDLPRAELSVSRWMRSSYVSLAGILVSFVAAAAGNNNAERAGNSGDPYHYEFALYDQRSLRVVIKDRTDGTWRIPALDTGVSFNDGEWNHLVVTWSSSSGRVRLFKNGASVFDSSTSGGGPYKKGALLYARGRIAAGQGMVRAETLEFSAHNGFVGDLQNLRVYRRDISMRSGFTTDMLWPFQLGAGAPRGHGHVLLYWRFSSAYFEGDGQQQQQEEDNGFVLSNVSIVNIAENAEANSPDPAISPGLDVYRGITSPTGTKIGGGVASAGATLSSCVEDDSWYFSAPSAFVTPTTFTTASSAQNTLVDLYNGRIQFEMRIASSAGTLRPPRGTVEIYSSVSPYVISYVLPWQFARSRGGDDASWLQYSVTLREDFSWVTEPSGSPVTHAEMLAVLGSATAIRIRGDAYVCDASGDGREAVYVNNLRLESPAAAAVLNLPR